jgi:hypothetical protein
MRLNVVLPLPRFVLYPLTAVTIAVAHVYLSVGHLSQLVAGQVQWTHIWKRFGALFGAYVFAALATRGMRTRRQQAAMVADGLYHSAGVPDQKHNPIAQSTG